MNAVLLLIALMSQPKLTQAEVEKRLVHNGYTESLFETEWAIRQGARIIPILSKMLSQQKKYEASGEPTAGFPFNAEYTLAHIDNPDALVVLKKYKVTYGIQGWNLRHRMKSQGYGVAPRDLGLHPKANEKIGSVLLLKPGTEVKFLKRGIENSSEEGARGGPTVYDEVEVLGGAKRRGFVQRAGDSFDPFF